jgi:hypothetical protein
MSYPYCYLVYNKKRNKRVVITPWGVTVEYINGGLMDTNICPDRLYPGRHKLTRKEQIKIARNAVEGVYYTPQEVDIIYRMWQEKGYR